MSIYRVVIIVSFIFVCRNFEIIAQNLPIVGVPTFTSIKFVKINHDFQPGYRAAITLTLKLIEVETSKILASTNIATKTSELRLSPETALASSLDGINENILSFFNENLSQVLADGCGFRKQGVV